MKITTVGLLSAAAMTLTSVTVWSLTPPGEEPMVLSGHAGLSASPLTIASPDKWSFVAGGTLKVEGRLGHSRLEADRPGETFVFVNITPALGIAPSEPPPQNVAIVIDRSGSMRGKRLRNAIAAAREMVDRLRDGDMVSVVTYDAASTLLVPPTEVTPSARARIAAKLDGIFAGGDTCISCGIESAMTALSGRDDMVTRILLLSDGDATAGMLNVEAFTRLAERARSMGSAISAIGVDVDYNERVMSALARGSNGRHTFVADPSQLSAVFAAEARALSETVATGAELRVELARGVEVLEVFDRAFRRQGDTIVAPMGTFSSGDEKTLLLRVRVPRGAAGEQPIAGVRLSFRDHVSGGRGLCEGELALRFSSDPDAVSPLDPLVAGRVERARTAASLLEANRRFSSGDADGARRLLEEQRSKVRKKAKEVARRAPAPRKAEVDRDFQRQAAALDEAATGFATPPAAAPEQSRAGKAAVRSNTAQADQLAF